MYKPTLHTDILLESISVGQNVPSMFEHVSHSWSRHDEVCAAWRQTFWTLHFSLMCGGNHRLTCT